MAPVLTIYTPKQPIVEIHPLWDLKQEAQDKSGFKQRAKYCILFSGKSWDFYKHINKQGRYLFYISQYRRYSTNKMFLHLLWMINWHCVVYCLHWILEIVIFTVVMQLIRLFLVVNNNLIIDKLLQMTKKWPCFRLHCWHTSESCDSYGTAAQTHANDQSVFYFFSACCHEMYEPDCLTRALTQLTVLQVHWLWERDDNGHPRTLYTEGQGCDGLSTGTY